MKNRNKFIAAILISFFTGAGCMYCINSNSSNNNVSDNEVIELKEEAPSYNVIKKGDEESQFVVKQEVKPTPTISPIPTISKNKSDKKANCELLQFPQLSDEDIYYLKKIVTCEATYSDIHTKQLMMLVVLNRVKSPLFPNSVYEVITQKSGKVYQFSVCAPGNSWYYTEPDEESEKAFEELWDTLYDYSCGALYFESYPSKEQADDTWFGSLEYLYEHEGVRYYK